MALYVFCYGTLKRGSSRSMEKSYPDSLFLCKDVIKDYTLYKMPFRHVPVMAHHPGGEVQGEIYLINLLTLSDLDKREGIHTGWYTREYIDNLAVYVYVWNHPTWFFKHLGKNFVP